MTTVHVNLGERSYDIAIGRDIPIGASLAARKTTRALIVSDTHVDPLYGDRCEALLRERGLETARAVVPAGEETKSLKFVRDLYDKALEAGLDRSSVIVALGGGVIGDLAGYVAATFLRGIRLIQAPTSLLAMVDSSVGGKTGVNLPQGKNLIGSFYQPVEVAADIAALETLPDREFISGLAEVVKYGVIWDAVLFKQIEDSAQQLLDRDPDALEAIITRCCEIKAEVVAMDEEESGARAILNFGHTLAHAIETVSGYGKFLHGEAVSLGMIYAANVSAREGTFTQEESARLVDLLKRLKLPVKLANSDVDLSWRDLRAAISMDKKTRGDVPKLVLVDRLGAVRFGREVNEQALEEAFGTLAEGE